MKNFKRLMAVVLTVVMLSTVSFAAGLSSSDMINYKAYIDAATITQGTTTFTVNVGVKNTAGGTIDIPTNANPGYFSTALSDEAIAAGIKATAITSDIVTITDATFEDTLFYCNINVDKQDLVLDANTPLLTVTFTIPANAATGTYNLSCVDAEYDGLALFGATVADATGVLWWEDAPFVTVKAAAAEPVEVTATVESEGKETVNGKDNSYWGLWVGRYSVVPGTKTLKSAVVSFADTNKTFPVSEINASGEGKVTFAVAIFGVPDEYATGKSSAVATLQ